eukprot:GFUD01044647.1.p1 GENE.GFUD01044647.1~~GFUD01044647.1.p1  ORF type:complete len:391 (-),score=71.88 GFUD01044647.1:195-1367(-)
MRDISNMKILIQVLLCICYVKAQEGIYPIPVNELYGDFFNNTAGTGLGCNPKSVKNPREYETCLSETPFHTDYGCRYYKIFRPMCYCCGHYYHYIELADICTKFCLNSDTSQPKYGQERLITLPFNWGWETPHRITLDDGTEVPVPCGPLDGATYGCKDEDSDGFRKTPFSVKQNNEKTKEKIRIEPTTRQPKKRTTTIVNIKSISTFSTVKNTHRNEEVKPTTRSPKRRTTTILNSANTKPKRTFSTVQDQDKRIKIKPTTAPTKSRTTTILNSSNIRSRSTSQKRKITTATTKTATQRTTTIIKDTRVPFSLTKNTNQNINNPSSETTEPPRIWGNNVVSKKESLQTKTTTVREKVIPSTTGQEPIWYAKKPRKQKEIKILDGLPVWG